MQDVDAFFLGRQTYVVRLRVSLAAMAAAAVE